MIGIAPELINLMCAKAKIDCQLNFKFLWKRLLESAKTTRNYGIFAAARTPKRESDFSWVGPLTNVKWVLFKLSSSPVTVSSLDELKALKLKVGGEIGNESANYLSSQGIHVKVAIDNQANLVKLQKKQIDFWVVDSLAGYYFAKRANIAGLQEALVVKETALWLALNKEVSPEVVTKLQNALNEIKNSLVYDSIHAKYR